MAMSLDDRAGPADDAGMQSQRLRRRLLASLGARGGSRTAERPPWYGQRVASEPGFVLSPGGWTPPPGVLPGWSWVPPEGALPRLDIVPWWVRAWYEVPLLDRCAHAWMWAHGGWEVHPPSVTPPGDQAGGREPRSPIVAGLQPEKAEAMPREEQQPH
jgi:hypothetical protein